MQRRRRASQQGAVSPDHDLVDLNIATTGHSLWLAIEAAQYARIMLHEEPETEAEEQAMSDFVEAFARYTEVWEETASQTKAAFLETLGHHLATLRERGLYVHWARAERFLASPKQLEQSVTLAVVSVGRTSDPKIRVAIPTELEVGEETLESDD